MLVVTSWTAVAVTILLVGMTFRVIQLRMAGRVSIGDGANPMLAAAVRGHGNLAEYAPLALILIGLLEAAGATRGPLTALAATFVVARILHAIAFGKPAGPPTATRTLGMVGTLGTLTAGAVWLALLAL